MRNPEFRHTLEIAEITRGEYKTNTRIQLKRKRGCLPMPHRARVNCGEMVEGTHEDNPLVDYER